MKENTFIYADDQWKRIKDALIRAKINDPDGMIVESIKEGWRLPFREVLNGIGGEWLDIIRNEPNRLWLRPASKQLKIIEDAAKSFRNAREALEERYVAIWGYGSSQDKDYLKLLCGLKDAESRCVDACGRIRAHRRGNKRGAPSLKSVIEAVYLHRNTKPFQPSDFIDSLIGIYDDIGCYVGGNADGPGVAFLQAAAKPVLGKNLPTPNALKHRLHRWQRAGGHFIEPCDPSPPRPLTVPMPFQGWPSEDEK